MFIRTAEVGMQHNMMVLEVVKLLTQRNQASIRADLPGFARPETIEGETGNHVPDVSATGLIVEVETADSISDQHTASQWKVFSDEAQQRGWKFWVVVPKGCRQEAEARCHELGIQAIVFEV